MNKNIIIAVILAVLLIGTGIIVLHVVNRKKTPVAVVQKVEPTPAALAQVDSSITVTVKSKPDNNVVMDVTGMAGKMTSVDYELTYESEGLIKGVNSGSKPIDVTGKDEMTREVYLGTCSKNVCKPDTGVTKISVVLEFTGTDGKKSQFSKDFDI